MLNLSIEEIKRANKDALRKCVLAMKQNPSTEGALFTILESLREEIKELKTQISVIMNDRNENVKVNEKIVALEKENGHLNQYTRRNNVEISGIPKIFDNKLEEKVVELSNSLGVNVSTNDVEACHRLKGNGSDPKRVIVRFTNRKYAEKLVNVRKETENIDLERLGFPSETKIYINENLCPYFRKIWTKCRKLKAEGEIKYVWTTNGLVKIRKDDTSAMYKIEHENDLTELFPNFEF